MERVEDFHLEPDVRRRIFKRYREQMKKWAPRLVQSRAPAATKGLMVMITELWERPKRRRKRLSPVGEHRTIRRRRARWQKGGYGVYDLRFLRIFGSWIKRVEEEF